MDFVGLFSSNNFTMKIEFDVKCKDYLNDLVKNIK